MSDLASANRPSDWFEGQIPDLEEWLESIAKREAKRASHAKEKRNFGITHQCSRRIERRRDGDAF